MSNQPNRKASAIWLTGFILAAGAILCLASLACSVGQAVVGRPAAVPTATKTKRPTFTPLPGARGVAATPAAIVRGELPPGVTVEAPGGDQVVSGQFTGTLSSTSSAAGGDTNVVLFATATLPPSATPEPTNTPGPPPSPTVDVETNRPTRAAGPRALPTPYVVVNSATLNGRRGPGLTFERLGEAVKGAELMVLARTTDGKWWQVCCLANQPVWVSADLVTAKGPVDAVPALTPPPTPRPAPRPPPTSTPPPRPTPMPPFDIARGPERFITREDGVMTIWAKVFEGNAPYEKVLTGYTLHVLRDGVDVSQPLQSGDSLYNTGKFQGNYDYNLKFEMYQAGEADWEIYLAKDGVRVSEVTKFSTKKDLAQNLVAYMSYWRVR
jgi:uncharacterized protein YgiM (DUF1202 family)